MKHIYELRLLRIRFQGWSKPKPNPKKQIVEHGRSDVYTYRSEATINTSRFTCRFFPLPQPTSSPTDPAGKLWRNCSTIGHGWKKQTRTSSSAWQQQELCEIISTGPGELTLYRVAEKCPAICWYTSWTFCSSYASAWSAIVATCREGCYLTQIRCLDGEYQFQLGCFVVVMADDKRGGHVVRGFFCGLGCPSAGWFIGMRECF